jgi:hypothetical protein
VTVNRVKMNTMRVHANVTRLPFKCFLNLKSKSGKLSEVYLAALEAAIYIRLFHCTTFPNAGLGRASLCVVNCSHIPANDETHGGRLCAPATDDNECLMQVCPYCLDCCRLSLELFRTTEIESQHRFPAFAIFTLEESKRQSSTH